MDLFTFERAFSDLEAAAASYYESDILLMSDAEYDDLYDKVQAALTANPHWANDETTRFFSSVAAGQSDGGNVIHPIRMLSLDKITLPHLDDVEGRAEILRDIVKFAERVSSASNDAVVVEPKMDGLALRVVYKDGHLVLAATRGNGSTGEDLTDRVLRGAGVVGLPERLHHVKWSGEVRGEIVMSVEQFEHAQVLRAERGGKPFANARNAASGAIRKSGDENWMPLTFIAYDVFGGAVSEEASHTGRMAKAAAHLGFIPAHSLVTMSGQPHEQVLQIEEQRPNLGFDIDGAVVKANYDDAREALGEGSRTPAWALAVKYPSEEATAVVEDVEVTVGRTGRIGLRARITPTFVAGTTVTYATVHNPSWIVEQGIGIGSRVLLKRAGDVIPRITGSLDGNADVPVWTPPATCPKCDEPWNKDSLLWRCETPACGLVNAITYFAARDCMDIDGLGESIAEALVENELVADVADLYTLDVEVLADMATGRTTSGEVRRLGVKNATKIVAEIEKSKAQPFNRVITALGIRLTGRSVGRWLAAEFPTMDRLRAASVDEVSNIEKMGSVKAAAVVDGIAKMADVIDRLARAGVNMGSEPSAGDSPKPLAGKTVVISGSVPGYTRTTVQERIEELGGKASGSVSKNTSYLVTDETTTSKAKKAAELGVPIIDPADFAALLAGEVE